MSERLLPYYNRELLAIRKLASEFAEAHPKIAGRLRLAPDAVDDPHVARLLDGVAFLSARVHQRLDDEFPELTDALLGALYPHFLAPFPSSAIVQFMPKPGQQGAVTLASGFEIETERVRGQGCRFRTAYEVQLWPVTIASARLAGQPVAAPVNPLAHGAASVLRLVLRTLAPDVTFASLGVDALRLHLRGGTAIAPQLYELLMANVTGIALADSPADPRPVLLPREALTPVGFGEGEALLPWSARGFAGFRLLTEYFAFPEKFLFLDLAGIDRKTLASGGNQMELFIYLNRSLPELERAVTAEHFALGCTPMVNLFAQQCEPVRLDHTKTEYRVVPDARRGPGMEVWSLSKVREVRQDGSSRPWRPFYRLNHGDTGPDGGFYLETRKDAGAALGGSDYFLAPFDPGFDPAAPAETVLSVDALCLNRDLPADLPFGGGHPHLAAVTPYDGVAGIACLTPPTPALRPALREGAWRLISHLSLGHLSLTGGAEGAAALKSMLRLYDRAETAESRKAIEALLSVDSRPGTARVPGGRIGGFCRGIDVTLEFDQKPYRDAGLFLLGTILERFLALHATVNSFVRTTIKVRGRAEPVMRFPPRAGARTLL